MSRTNEPRSHARIASYLGAVSMLDAHAFAMRHPGPFLLGADVRERGFRFATRLSVAPEASVLGPGDDVLSAQDWMIPVRKVAGAVGGQVFVGRSSSNDIVVPHDTVSKLHAYFARAGDVWSLVDTGSSNGTKVQRERLRTRVPRALASGDTIVFGKCRFVWLSAASAHARLSPLARAHSAAPTYS